MNVLITGANGQLGREIEMISPEYEQLNLIFAGSEACDISNKDQLGDFVTEKSVEAIINCAAYTAVDNAEDDEESAFQTNSSGVKNLVEICEEFGIKLIHISTDYVFDGNSFEPYETDDPINPIGVYGKSKRAGEKHILNSNSNSIIIRTSWLYSSFGNNFVKTMLRLGSERDELGIVNDQFGTPTYARDLANACLTIVSNDDLRANGAVYHFANHEVTTWFEFTKEIFRIANITCEVNPITTADYPTKARRPKYSALSSTKIERDFNVSNREWQNALSECLEAIYQA
jgi:dTDP-4-dehydrorhamnose reductase